MNASVRTSIIKRSMGRCEAFIQLENGYPSRCAERATDIHHMLTKARGGENLDSVNEIYHLVHLCRACHQASDGGAAYDNGLLLDGSVTWDRFRDRPVYSGSDPYLKGRYGT